jgi:quinol monooxygenase YgiN
MFVVTVVFEVERDAVPEFMARVRRQAQDSLEKEAGCHRFDVCVHAQHSDRIMLYEIYADAQAFADHLASEHFLAFDTDVSANVRSKKINSWSLA